MNDQPEISASEVKNLLAVLNKEAESGGYHLNPDTEVTEELVKGLLVNENRYGYRSCPCRLAAGEKEKDLDIICPCDYRDIDLNEYNTCYCGLYASREVVEGRVKIGSIPERRPPPGKRKKRATEQPEPSPGALPLPVWRCRVCGYLCARDEPPEVCPICGAKQERFERFI
jgi:ferredoxin-thioredoxin reductase catalytic chain